MMISWGNLKRDTEQSLFQCHFVHSKFTLIHLGSITALLGQKSGPNCVSYGMSIVLLLSIIIVIMMMMIIIITIIILIKGKVCRTP
jgi:hypothetical protein